MRRRVGNVFTVMAVLSCAGATLLPWRASGVGSAMAPYALARAALAGAFGDLMPRTAGLVPLAPAVACAVLIGLATTQAARRLSSVVAALLCCAPLVVLALAPGPGGLAPGGVLLVAAVVSALGAAVGDPGRSRAET